MLVHPTVTPVFCSLFTLLHSRFCFVTQRSSPSSSLEKKGVAWRHNNRLRRRLRIMTPVLNYTPGLRENIQEKNPLHRVVRGRITHLSIWGFTCLPWHIPAAHTIADKNTGSHVMSILRKQPTLCDANTGFLEERLEKFHAGDESLPRLGSASDQSDTFQIWIVTRHEYGISTHASQTLFRGGRGGWGKPCWRREMSAVFAFLRIQKYAYSLRDTLTAASASRVWTWYWCNAILIRSDNQSQIFVITDVYHSYKKG